MKTARLTNRQRTKLTETIVSNLQEFPANVRAALALSARQTNVTYEQARFAYYGKSSKKQNTLGIRHNQPCFITVTPNGFYINKKNIGITKQTKRTLALNERLISMDDLSTSEKVAFYDVIFG